MYTKDAGVVKEFLYSLPRFNHCSHFAQFALSFCLSQYIYIQISSIVLIMPFIPVGYHCPGSNPGSFSAFNCHLFLVSFHLEHFLSLSLGTLTLTLWNIIDNYFVVSLNLSFLLFPHPEIFFIYPYGQDIRHLRRECWITVLYSVYF